MMITATIRQRGQLTIPDQLRQKFSWLKDNTVVTIVASPLGEIIIKPLSIHASSDTHDWNEIWRRIHLTRSFRGKKKTKSLTQFIIEDRKNH